MNYCDTLKSLGLEIHGCSGDGTVWWVGEPNEPLAALVFAAHDKALTSTEGQALKSAITAEQWAAYVDCRKNPVRAARAERYKSETDALFLKCFEEASLVDQGDYYEAQVAKTKWTAWTEAKATIRDELPYPSEE